MYIIYNSDIKRKHISYSTVNTQFCQGYNVFCFFYSSYFTFILFFIFIIILFLFYFYFFVLFYYFVLFYFISF